MITTGDTIMSEHMALHDHTEGDISIRLLDFKSNWGKKRIKESHVMRSHVKSMDRNYFSNFVSRLLEIVPTGRIEKHFFIVLIINKRILLKNKYQ